MRRRATPNSQGKPLVTTGQTTGNRLADVLSPNCSKAPPFGSWELDVGSLRRVGASDAFHGEKSLDHHNEALRFTPEAACASWDGHPHAGPRPGDRRVQRARDI